MANKRQRSSRVDITPSAKQADVLRFIYAATKARGIPPTYREIGEYIGTRKHDPSPILKRLLQKGLIERVKRASRSHVVTPAGEKWVVEHSVAPTTAITPTQLTIPLVPELPAAPRATQLPP